MFAKHEAYSDLIDEQIYMLIIHQAALKVGAEVTLQDSRINIKQQKVMP